MRFTPTTPTDTKPRSLSSFGLLASENAVSITFKLPDGTDRVILRNDLRSLRSVDLSLMPDGLEAGQTLQGMADLIAFLKS